ncbi:MAG: MFS transporter [Lachnospiraceae bacterium]|nr:MFS transporter [Lachnospiraceae bacterium]
MKTNFKRFFVLWAGQLISAIGGGLTAFGLGVYVFEKTGSAASMGLVTLLGFLPTLVLSVPAGVLADRFDRRLLMMLGDGLSALGVIYILMCMMRGEASLVQICIGVAISAIFSSLMDPAYKATVSELLTKDEYSKASGLVSLAGSARFLISPLLAGLLLSVCDIKVLLIVDIATFVVTVLSTFAVKRGLKVQREVKNESFGESLMDGWRVLYRNRGAFMLVIVSVFLTLFVGVFQVLAEPLVLSMADAATLGIAETICACGMLVSSLYLGVRGIRRGYVKVLSASLALAGVFIMGFGLVMRISLITLCGFGFFLMLPFANNCLDYLVRTNTPTDMQGRIWGIVGFLSQLGYVVAYGLSGVLADKLAAVQGIDVGRGAGLVMAVSGGALILVSVGMLMLRDIRGLEPEKAAGREQAA